MFKYLWLIFLLAFLIYSLAILIQEALYIHKNWNDLLVFHICMPAMIPKKTIINFTMELYKRFDHKHQKLSNIWKFIFIFIAAVIIINSFGEFLTSYMIK